MKKKDIDAKIQLAYERTLAGLYAAEEEIEITKENMFNLALLYSGKVTVYLLEELGLIDPVEESSASAPAPQQK